MLFGVGEDGGNLFLQWEGDSILLTIDNGITFKTVGGECQ